MRGASDGPVEGCDAAAMRSGVCNCQLKSIDAMSTFFASASASRFDFANARAASRRVVPLTSFSPMLPEVSTSTAILGFTSR